MSAILRLRVFVSSPGDVASERAVALAIGKRLQFEFQGRVELEFLFWEQLILRATETFQTQIPDIQDVDLALFILWSRMGTPLPDTILRLDGSRYKSGTEYEFEQALAGYQRDKRPELVCYFKTAEVRISRRDRERRQQQEAQLKTIDDFTDKWFISSDGSLKSAFHEFESTAQFEIMVEMHLRDWIRKRLALLEPNAADRRAWEGSPFRGLERFDFEHSLIYCGRTGLVADVIEMLRRRGGAGRGFVMVTGMSGVGKSSLVRAGVLPLLTGPSVIEKVIAWRRAVFIPNDSQPGLFAGFAAALVDADALPELGEQDASRTALLDPATLVPALMKALNEATAKARESTPGCDPVGTVRLVVVVDQFEEIFDETVTNDECIAFVEALRTMVNTGAVWVIVTLRADFYGRCAELPEHFRDLFIERNGLYVVGGPRPAEIAQMIRRPAAMAGLQFERNEHSDDGLDDVLTNAASGNPSVLPLLEFTLDELWKKSGDAGVLRFADYKELGGLDGALSRRADQEFERLSDHVRASLPKVLAALVHTDATDDRLILQNRVSLNDFSEFPEARELIDAFIAARLMVSDQGPDATPVVGLAHEALLKQWTPAVQWIDGNRELLGLRAGVYGAAAHWEKSGRDDRRLLSGALLEDAKRILKENPHLLAADAKEFVELSIAEHRRRNKNVVYLRTSAASIVAVVLLFLTVGASGMSYGLSFVQALASVSADAPGVPVSEPVRATLSASIASLKSHLETRLPKMGYESELVPWTMAEIWAALFEPRSPLLARAGDLRQFLNRQRIDDCKCWAETSGGPPHAIVTAWVLSALARYDQPAEREEIARTLSRQRPAGWWSMFPSSLDGKNASTSATALTALALHQQLKHNLLAADQRESVSQAVDRAARWLQGRRLPGEARWKEYPPDATFEKDVDYRAVSALVLFVLRMIANESEFDGLWLDQLPRETPGVSEDEVSKGFVKGENAFFALDQVRHYRYPWMLRATVNAYASGSRRQKARGMLWIERMLARPLTPADFQINVSDYADWTMAEVLLSLRHAAGVLAPKP